MADKRIICILASFLFFLGVKSQVNDNAPNVQAETHDDFTKVIQEIQATRDAGNYEYSQMVKDNEPISPHAETLKKHGEYSLDYSTGVPHISIPLYEIKTGNHTLPISINYHASGIKVQDVASPVGLGWSLMAGGSIVCQVKCQKDNGLPSYKNENEIWNFYNSGSSTDTGWSYLAIGKGGDTESDRYIYHFNGKNGVFRYDVADNMAIKTIPYSPIKIAKIGTGYKITDTDGTHYYFMKEEKNRGDFTDGGDSITTTWYLTKIKYADQNDSIMLTYSKYNYYYQQYKSEYIHRGNIYTCNPDEELDNWSSSLGNTDCSTIHTVECSNIHLSKITWRGGSVNFNYSADRNDYVMYNSNNKLPRLTSMTVKNYNNNTIRTVTFDNAHYVGGSALSNRMFLQGLTITGASSASGNEIYSFNYNSTTLPNYFNGTMAYPTTHDTNCHEDYWGYANNTSSTHWIPSDYAIATVTGGNRNVNENYAKSGILERITYPTGGYTVFNYESNRLDNNTLWGGLRVHDVSNYDSDGTQLSQKTYQYSSAVPAVSNLGDLYQYESYYTYRYHEWEYGRLIQHSATALHDVSASNPVIPLTADYGSPIYYQTVTEYYGTINSNLGKTVYSYTENRTGDWGDYEDSDASSLEHLRTYSTTYHIDQGIITPLLTSKRVYKNTNGSYILDHSEDYSYEEVNLSAFQIGVRFLFKEGYIGLSPSVIYPDISLFSDIYTYHNVYALPSYMRLSSKTVKDYGASAIVTTTYGYDSNLQTLDPISERGSSPSGDFYEYKYSYPFDLAGYGDMVNANMLIPVKTRLYRFGTLVETIINSYTSQNGIIVNTGTSTAKGNNTPELRVQYDYDSFGNLAYIEKDGTDKTVFLWGYQGLYPVAKITGQTKSQVYTTLGNMVNTLAGTPTDSQIHGIKTTLGVSALATTYTYSPLVGMTSMQSPRGENTFFSYDSMGRLSGITDHHNHIIESYAYSYGTHSYVQKTTMINSSGNGRVTKDYFDGLGRHCETVAQGQSPTGQDLISLVGYDNLDRLNKQYRPIAYSNSGNYLAPSTFQSTASTFYSDSYPYSETIYESCPSDKPIKKFGPGGVWRNNDSAVKKEYTTNSNTAPYNCRYYEVLSSGLGLYLEGNYTSGDLFVVKTTDEDENVSLTFTDKEGRLILERRMKWSTPYDTYYVYDISGNLAFVLPPAASDALTETDTNWYIGSNTILQQYAYHYRYDQRNRCIVKKLPGCGNIQMTYDTADRLSTRQDGNGTTTYYEYDNFGRQTEMGIQNTGGSHTPLITNYYDGYTFLTDSNLNFNATGGSDSAFPSARGMLTGTKIAQLNNPANVSYTSYYYGDRERLVQSHQQNHLGGYEHEYYTYNFTGTTATKNHVHSATGQSTQTELYTYTYDGADRLLSTTHKLNNDTPMTLSTNTYDAVGRLSSKQMMDGDNISYTYNVRSWLTGISSTNFIETIAYNSTVNGLTPGYDCHGGDIAAMRWKTSNENITRGFQLYYNPLGWLTHAYTYKNDNEVYNFNVEYNYDKMGNMTDFWRGGYISEGSYNHIDMPELTLNGNQMTRVDDYDHVLYYPYNKSFHFVDAASQDNEYTYDQNGNMTQDLNRKISSIQYNLLNLPQNMTYSNNKSTTYVYDATGRKLQVEYVNPATTFDYCGNMIYVNGTLDRILVDDGYIEPYEGEMYYSYYLKDHQGNNRVVAYDNGVVAEVNHYYPFGLLFGESEDPETQKFKYNNKEFDRYHGLDMYDYGARFYDPSICRFTTMDPMSEKYYNLSPYIYCGNNPINAVDLHGDSIYIGYEHQEELLGMINKLSEGEFGVSENGFLYLKHTTKPAVDVNNYSSFYRDLIVQGINSSNTISIKYSSEANFKGNSYDLKKYGEGLTIVDGQKAYVYISGKEHTTLSGTYSNPEIILAHELAGHAIPSVTCSFLSPQYDGMAVTAENIIREEVGMSKRIWGKSENKHYSVPSLINPFGRVFINRQFQIYY